MTQKSLADYLKLPYTIELRPEEPEADEAPVWFARAVELPGCMTEGDTPEEALNMIQDAMAAWIEVALENDRPIPEPRPSEDYSGKFVVRVPKSLHRELVEAAHREGVSLNQWINVALSRAVGVAAAHTSPQDRRDQSFAALGERRQQVREG